MAESTRRHWDRFWTEHAAIDDVYSNEGRIVNELLRLEPAGKRVIEVGAGSGRDALELAIRGARTILVDYSTPSLHTAGKLAERAGVGVSLVRADGLRLPFRAESVDIVFHQGLLEHFRDPMPLLAENVRVLARGGHLLVDVPQRYHVYTLLKHALMAVGRWFAGWETEFSIGQLERLVRRSGLEVAWSYGDWMVPGVFYRALRACLRRGGWVLPKYPGGIWPFNELAAAARRRLRGTWLAFHSYAMIGTVGRKPG
jgi:SAM-dependent methyltransferase